MPEADRIDDEGEEYRDVGQGEGDRPDVVRAVQPAEPGARRRRARRAAASDGKCLLCYAHVRLARITSTIFAKISLQRLNALSTASADLHAVLDDVGMGLAPELLGVGLAPGRREPSIDRHGRIQHGFRDIGLQARHLGAEPERVVLHELRDRRHPTAQAGLQVLVHHLRLHEELHEVLGDLDVLRTLRDVAAAGVDLGLHRRAVILVQPAPPSSCHGRTPACP